MKSAVSPAPATHVLTGNAWQWSGPYTLEAVREASIGARDFLHRSGLPAGEPAAWELLIMEVGNNCVIHGGGGLESECWEVRLLSTRDRTVGVFTDRTIGFDWPEHADLPDDDDESGRGIFLIHSLTDTRCYSRHDRLNILTLGRNHAPVRPPENLEATLDSMTEELASCYESLAAIFHFTAEARGATSLADFSSNLLRHLVTITRAESGVLRVVSGNQLTTLVVHGCEAPATCPMDESPIALEAAALASRQTQWTDSDGESSPATQTAFVHPFYNEDELMGVLMLGRDASAPPLNAGEVNMVHTFAEFLTQQMLSRRHEEQAIQSSIARREFELAAAIQQSLLPPPLPDLAGSSVTGHCESALSIGGDFYDFVPCGENGYFFVIADVMGKGVAASMMAAVTRSFVRSLDHLHQFPDRLLQRVALLMHDDLNRLEMFVTVAVGIVDVRDGFIRISNAGHCPVLVHIPGKGIIEAGPEQPPLGLDKTSTFKEHEIPLVPGARLLAYTDGLLDPRNQRPSFDSQNDITTWFSHAAARGAGVSKLRNSLLRRLGQSEAAGILADDQTFLLMGYR